MNQRRIRRRSVLTATLGATLTGCGIAAVPATPPAPASAPPPSAARAVVLGERNDVAIILPPDHAPLVLAVCTDPDDPRSTAGDATVAEATATPARRPVTRTAPHHVAPPFDTQQQRKRSRR